MFGESTGGLYAILKRNWQPGQGASLSSSVIEKFQLFFKIWYFFKGQIRERFFIECPLGGRVQCEGRAAAKSQRTTGEPPIR